MVLGIAIGLVVFFWALRNGQFKDQQRARFLPLQGQPEPPIAQASKYSRYEVYVLLFLAMAGLVASIAVVAFALLSAG